MLVGILLWGPAYPHRFVVYYFDNDAARAALVKAWSDSIEANAIIECFVNAELQFSLKPWFGRAPTHSNPADDSSRMKCEHLMAAGVTRCHFEWRADFVDQLCVAHCESRYMRVCDALLVIWFGRWPTFLKNADDIEEPPFTHCTLLVKREEEKKTDATQSRALSCL